MGYLSCINPVGSVRRGGGMSRFGIVLMVLAAAALQAGGVELNWPEFRGPRGDGTSTATNLPLHWSEQQNVKWQTPIHGRAWSSPVIWDQQIWMTTATTNGRELFVICVDRDSGKIIRDLKLFEVEKPQYAHPFNTYASPTPAIEAGKVYVTFGAPGTACLDTQTGKVLWSRRDLECNHFRGAGSSPMIYRDLLILNFDGSDHQFLVAFDKQTGRTRWQKRRSIDYQDLGPDGQPEMGGDYRKAFATCQMASFDGATTLLSQGSRALYAYEPLTGDELWRVEERSSYSGGTRPITGHGLVFVPSGFGSGMVLAIRPGQRGEVLDARATAPTDMQLRVVWKDKRNAPKKPSLLLLGDLLYAVDDNGTATCWEATTGKVVWSERIGGHYSASPLAAGGRIYLFSEDGKATVIAAGPEFKKLAENQLGDGFMASAAVSGKALYLRSRTQLYRVEE
jgi:outer membrane protein assembly factor BamB